MLGASERPAPEAGCVSATPSDSRGMMEHAARRRVHSAIALARLRIDDGEYSIDGETSIVDGRRRPADGAGRLARRSAGALPPPAIADPPALHRSGDDEPGARGQARARPW